MKPTSLLFVIVIAACNSDDGTCVLPGSAHEPVVAGPLDGDRARKLAAVRSWQYYLDVDIGADEIGAIERSAHDMLVIDFIPSEQSNTTFDMSGLVARMHATNKLVIAYLDVGQAERYRTYWRPEWGVGAAASPWIVAEDPDGWTDNYPVAYWDARWQAIWLAPGGLIDQVVAAGFDGIYLDWIEGYSDERVVAAAARDAVDARGEMVTWVERLAARARTQRDLMVIGQNAAELAADSAQYRQAIDALAQEQTWFDGAADNDPQGDCPLPPTDGHVETDAYVACLSGGCRELHDRYPDSTLHVSTESYLEALDRVLAAGTPVFTVDYVTTDDNITFVLDEARGRGYIPTYGPRALDAVVEAR